MISRIALALAAVIAMIGSIAVSAPASAQRPAWCHHDCIAVCRALYTGRDADTCIRNRRCQARFGDNVCATPQTVQYYIDRACATQVPLPRGCMRRYDVRSRNRTGG